MTCFCFLQYILCIGHIQCKIDMICMERVEGATYILVAKYVRFYNIILLDLCNFPYMWQLRGTVGFCSNFRKRKVYVPPPPPFPQRLDQLFIIQQRAPYSFFFLGILKKCFFSFLLKLTELFLITTRLPFWGCASLSCMLQRHWCHEKQQVIHYN